jgi:glycosyltransferase involved in cell wall biosynthesis
VNGFANMCALMLARLRETAEVQVFDRAPAAGKLRNLWRNIVLPLRYGWSCLKRRGTLYLALSGGFGQWLDLPYVLISKLFGRPIFVHHHSFSYINSVTLTNRCFFFFVRRAHHIVLSEGMGAALALRYRLPVAQMLVVSNAAFFRIDPLPDPGALAPTIRVGFLANITADKGFVEFFDILEQLRRSGVTFRARIAGPLAAGARRQFEQLLAAAPEAEYVGPVYGEDKERFYRELDVFVFPTKYPNEAEPLVLYEAMKACVYVIASDRGAIRDMLGDAGLVAAGDAIVARAAQRIQQLSEDAQALRAARAASLDQAARVSAAAAINLSAFLRSLAGQEPDRARSAV